MEASKRREYNFSSFYPESGILGRWCFQGHVTPLVTAWQGGSASSPVGLAGKQLLSTRGRQAPLFRSFFGNPGRPLALLCWTGPPASIFRPSVMTLSVQAWRSPTSPSQETAYSLGDLGRDPLWESSSCRKAGCEGGVRQVTLHRAFKAPGGWGLVGGKHAIVSSHFKFSKIK